MKDLLSKLEIDKEIQDKIITGMKEEGIHTTKEENLDIRYSKLKEEKEALEEELNTAKTTLEDLKENTKGKEELKESLAEYEEKIKELEEVRKKEKVQYELESKLKDAGATDTDYLIYKLGGVDKVELDEEGNIKDLDNIVKGLQEEHELMFKTETDPEIIPNPLPEDKGEVDLVAEEFAEALKGQY